MRTVSLCIALGLIAVLAVSTASIAGVTIEDNYYSDAYYLETDNYGGGVYGCHGSESGTGYSGTLITGSARLAGGYVYFGLDGNANTYGGGYYGTMFIENIVIALPAKTGSGVYTYLGVNSGGTPVGFGGTSDFTMTLTVGPSPDIAEGAVGPFQAGQ
jgi:hypothetical protein